MGFKLPFLLAASIKKTHLFAYYYADAYHTPGPKQVVMA